MKAAEDREATTDDSTRPPAKVWHMKDALILLHNNTVLYPLRGAGGGVDCARSGDWKCVPQRVFWIQEMLKRASEFGIFFPGVAFCALAPEPAPRACTLAHGARPSSRPCRPRPRRPPDLDTGDTCDNANIHLSPVPKFCLIKNEDDPHYGFLAPQADDVDHPLCVAAPA